MIVVVMGVSGAGKTTIGERLAARLGCDFVDADDFHPPRNVEKMRAGHALTDEDRWPWLAQLNAELRGRGRAVLACSALRQSYRDRICSGLGSCGIVYLRGTFELLSERAAARRHRYMPASLLRSQFDTLEPPVGAIEIDVSLPVDQCVEAIVDRLA